jgi:anti-sigma regulatory factor (Ser/Thr protein kinase)
MMSESFTPSPSEISAARRFAVAAAEHLGCCPTDLALVVSELATNACVHARSPFMVTVERHDAGLLVEISDDDPVPVVVQPLTSGPSGRGMHIVGPWRSSGGWPPASRAKRSGPSWTVPEPFRPPEAG